MSARHLTTVAVRVTLITLGCSACAAPFQRAIPGKPLTSPDRVAPSSLAQLARPSVGVAFGGGSARGIAHVGVIRWLEEHRIPIDAAAGTSMGGLIGGAYASGMDAAELETFIASLDWDQLFGASSFAHKNIRRKADARAYPARLEFGLRGGIVPPTALNNGEYVELLLGRIAAPYFDVDGLRRSADAISHRGRRPPVGAAGGHAQRIAGGCDARHDVAAADFPPGRAQWAGADRRRDDEQRAGGRGEGDGSRPGRSPSTSATFPIAKASATRCSGSRAPRSTP